MEEKLRVDNPANNFMKYDSWHLESVTPPDSLPKYRIYSNEETQRLYNQLEQDIYQKYNKIEPKKKGFPKILKYFIGIGLATLLAFISKEPIMNLFTKFRRP